MTTKAAQDRDIDVFISYKREERALAIQVAGALEAAGYTQVTDLNLTNGSNFGTEIDRLIRRARVVLVLWTEASVESHWVQTEASLARKLGTYLGVIVEPTELPIEFRILQAEDLDRPLADSLPRIVAAVTDRIGPPQETPAVATGQSASLNDDLMLFQTAREAASTTSYRAYLRRFPQGVMADEARRWIAQAEKEETRRKSFGHRLRSALPTTAAVGTAIAAGGLLLNYLTADLPWRDRAQEAVIAALGSERPSPAPADLQVPPPDCTAEDGNPGYRIAGAGCVSVETTELSRLASDFSDADAPKLAGLTGLRELSLANTEISDLAPLGGLAELRTLNLSLTQVTDLSPLRVLGGLRTLSFSGTNVADLAPVAGLDDLETLNASRTFVTNIAPIAGLRDLKSLDIAETPVSDFQPLSELQNLEDLDLGNTGITDLAPLRDLTRLRELSLFDTDVSSLEALSGLVLLRRLNIDRTDVRSIHPLSSLTGLRDLTLGITLVTDLGPLSSLADLEVLIAVGPAVFDISPLAGLGNLRVLQLLWTEVRDLTPLEDLTRMENLLLTGAPATDLTPLARMSGLWRLVLPDGTTIGGSPNSAEDVQDVQDWLDANVR